jgi:hypothetical protein
VFPPSREYLTSHFEEPGLLSRHMGLDGRDSIPIESSPPMGPPGALSTGLTRKGSESHHSPAPSGEVKNNGAIHPRPHTSSRRGA